MKEECTGAQFSAAEKGGKGMAFKIFTGAKPFLKASCSGITEMRMLPHLSSWGICRSAVFA